MRGRAIRVGAIAVYLASIGAARAADPLTARVAVPAPKTGVHGLRGRAVHAAASMVATDIAARGQVTLDIVTVEDPCSSMDANRVAEALAAAKFDAVIGLPCRASALAAAPVFARAGQVLIAVAPLVPPLAPARAGLTVFHMPVAQRSLGQFLGDELAASPAQSKLAIIRDKTQQAVSLAAIVETTVRAHGRAIAAVEVFSGGDKAFGTMVSRLKALGVTHIALLAFPVEGGLIIRELTAEVPDAVLIGPDFLLGHDTSAVANQRATRLRLILPSEHPFARSAAIDEPAARLLTERLPKDRLPLTRDAITIAAALELYAAAVQRAGTVEPTAVASALVTPAETRFGSFAFDARGHIVVPYWGVHVWRDGRWAATP